MLRYIYNFLALLIFLLASCVTGTNNENLIPYKLTELNELFVLPDTLREISGLTGVDSNTFACVQDENGILFIYDMEKNQISKQYKFSYDGDYEGLAKVEDTMYILRSDGTLFEISNYQKPNFVLTTYNTGIPAKDNEGLCYDKNHNRLLIACKGKIKKGSKFKKRSAIYGFDLVSKKLSKEPVVDIDLDEIKAFAIQNNIDLPTKANKKKGKVTIEPVIKFKASAIAIHPTTQQIYVLSAADNLFFVFNENREIEHIEYLNPRNFNKAEGITFLENNDMLISNEGEKGNPTVLRFSYIK